MVRANWGGEANRITFGPAAPGDEMILAALTAVGLSAADADPLVSPLTTACAEFDIMSDLRRAHFIGQLTHESDHFRTTEEYASGKNYEGRLDLGNTDPGDGAKYKGHGWIMVTGKSNHMAMARHFGIPFESIVAWLMTYEGAARSAGFFWYSRSCNAWADKDDVEGVTRIINGGLNGLAQRVEYVSAVKRAFGIQGVK